MNTNGSITFQGIANNGGAVPFAGADNGLSLDGASGKVVLGGPASAPSNLIDSRRINLNGNTLQISGTGGASGGYVRFLNSGAIDVRTSNNSGIDSIFIRNESADPSSHASVSVSSGSGFPAIGRLTAQGANHFLYPKSIMLATDSDTDELILRASSALNPSGQKIRFITGFDERMSIHADGIVFIGRNTPISSSTNLMQVEGGASFNAGINEMVEVYSATSSGVGFGIRGSSGRFAGMWRGPTTANRLFIGNAPLATNMISSIEFKVAAAGTTLGEFQMLPSGNFNASGVITSSGINTDSITWRFQGQTTAAAVLDSTRYLNITLNGTPYKLALIQ